ncbi:hypothetical protein LV779_11400 [Streptomyces thinghirensis]|nr:hypothetical protein [Streptomyces thinghirensis]
MPAAVQAGAEGVGLFRTEFLFLDDSESSAVGGEQGHRLPAGAGGVPRGPGRRARPGRRRRQAAGLPDPGRRADPALGVRGLRTLLDHPDVLRTQLTALAKAAEGLPVYLEVMAPMVADRADAKAFADACREAGLRARSSARWSRFRPPRCGRSSVLQEVEFLSLGTNDLAQYTFAADRQVGAVSRLQDPWQPALLDLVALSRRRRRPRARAVVSAVRPRRTRCWRVC